MRKYPQLVPDRVCDTPCKVTIYSEEISKSGSLIKLLDKNLFCNYQDKAYRNYGNQTTQTVVVGQCLFNGDIAPELAVISSGIVNIFGVDRKITNGQKNRNPDGSVNYTRLEIS